MEKLKGFLEIRRKDPGYRPAKQRVRDSQEVERRLSPEEISLQAHRCMDCGIPFCHGAGCPVRNVIPEVNAMAAEGRWRDALEILVSTNNFPEFTGRICPALCEAACTAGLNDDPVAIRQIEITVIEKGFEEGWFKPSPPEKRSGRKVAVIGSGPAGLALADQLNRMGHTVTVFEKDRYVGGLLRYGIPDFKLSKGIVQRRIDFMTREGVRFESGIHVGVDVASGYLRKRFDAICLACGCRVPRDLPVPGRDLGGIHFAMDFLCQQNCRITGEEVREPGIVAAGKDVLVIGGGDTGSDCVGTSIRQGAKSVTQIEILPQPPDLRHPSTPWPEWPYQMRCSSSHEEGCNRIWSVMTHGFEGSGGVVRRANLVRLEWDSDDTGRPVSLHEIPDSEWKIDADLVLLAMGFTGPEREGLLDQFGIELNSRGNVVVDASGMTSVPGVFAAGDVVRGPSLVVRAIADGRALAAVVHRYLMDSHRK